MKCSCDDSIMYSDRSIGTREVIGMTEAKVVMDNFMRKLAADEYKKENQPNNGPEINPEFIEEQLMSYSKLLQSGILKAALGE